MSTMHFLTARRNVQSNIDFCQRDVLRLASLFLGENLSEPVTPSNSDQNYLVLNKLLQLLQENILAARELILFLGSRLHRDVAPSKLYQLADLLNVILKTHPVLRTATLQLASKFPDVLIPLASHALLTVSEFDESTWSELLNIYCSCPFQSANLSIREFYIFLSSLFLQLSKEGIGKMCLSSAFSILLRAFSLDEKSSPNDCLLFYELALGILSSIVDNSKCDPTLSGELLNTVLELIMKVKRFDLEIDCSQLITMLCGFRNEIIPLVCSVPTYFSVRESLAALNCAPCQTVAMFLISENPFLSRIEEMAVSNHLSDKIDTLGLNSAPHKEITTMDPYILLIENVHRLTVGEIRNEIGLEEAHAIFLATYLRLFRVNYTHVDVDVKMLVKITKIHPIFAERLFMIITRLLNSCSDLPSFNSLVQSLVQIAEIDDFCRDRSVGLIRQLVSSSFYLRCQILPLVANELYLTGKQHWFTLLSECLPPLAYGSEATSSSVSSMAVCLYHLVLTDSRQSFLNFAFSTTQAIFKGRLCGSVPDFSPQATALLIECLARLCRIRYISPKLAWALIKGGQISSMRHERLVRQSILGMSSLMASLMPVAETEDEVVDYTILVSELQEYIDFVMASLPIDPISVLRAIIDFPRKYLEYIDFKVAEKCTQYLSIVYPSTGNADTTWGSLESFLTEWLKRDIEQMPRSLFIGTSRFNPTATPKGPEVKDRSLASSSSRKLIQEKTSSWSGNPVLAAARLNEATLDEDFAQAVASIIALPPLTLSHWMQRLFFLRSVSKYIYRIISNVADEITYPSLVANALNICEAKLKGSSISQVSYAILIQTLIKIHQCKIEGNTNPLLDVISDISLILFPGEKPGAPVDPKICRNDEIVAICCYLLAYVQENAGTQPSIARKVTAVRSELVNTIDHLFKTGSWPDIAFNVYFSKDSHSECTWPGYKEYVSSEKQSSSEIAFYLAILENPGPAMKKIEACYRLAGYFQIVPDISETSELLDKQVLLDTARVLQDSLKISTDGRLVSWLVILFQRVHDLLSILVTSESLATKPHVQSTKSSSINRFDPESAMGWCLDKIFDDHESEIQDAIWKALSKLDKIPKMEWEKFPPGLIPGHVIRSKLATMPLTLIDPLTREQYSESDLNLFGSILDALRADQSLQCQFAINQLSNDPQLLLVIARHMDKFTSIEPLTPSLMTLFRPHLPFEALIMLAPPLARINADNIHLRLLSISYAKHQVGEAVELAINVVLADRLWIPAVAKRLARISPACTLDIANHMLLAVDSNEQYFAILTELFKSALLEVAESLGNIKYVGLGDSSNLILAWYNLQRAEPALSYKISRKIAQIISFLPEDDPLNFI